MRAIKNESDMIQQTEMKKGHEQASLKAVLCIQRMWKRKQARRAHLKELDIKFKETKNQEQKKAQAVQTIQKQWRKYLQDKKDGKTKGLFDFHGMVKVIHAQEGSTTGTIVLEE